MRIALGVVTIAAVVFGALVAFFIYALMAQAIGDWSPIAVLGFLWS